jgi:hypothetical protein
MPFIDNRGMLFGRLNLIDAVAGLGALFLVILGYGAYVLFRTPPPRLVSVDSYTGTLLEGPGEVVRLQGQSMRPYFLATVGTQSARFLFHTPQDALVQLPILEAGTYDLVLYDVAQEVARLTNGITIEETPPPPPVPPPPIPNAEVTVRGMFYPLDQAAALGLVATLDDRGSGSEAWGTILGFQQARRIGSAGFGVPAMLSLQCALVDAEDLADTAPVRGVRRLVCIFGDTVIGPGVNVALSLLGTTASFSISEVLPPETAPIEIVLRTVIRPEVAAAMTQETGDREASPALAEHEASLLSFEIVEEFAGQSTLADRQTGLLNLALVQLRVPATGTSSGWSHLGQPLKVGADYTFETAAYVLRGQIVDMRLASRSSSGPSE